MSDYQARPALCSQGWFRSTGVQLQSITSKVITGLSSGHCSSVCASERGELQWRCKVTLPVFGGVRSLEGHEGEVMRMDGRSPPDNQNELTLSLARSLTRSATAALWHGASFEWAFSILCEQVSAICICSSHKGLTGQ